MTDRDVKGDIWFVSLPLFGHLGPLLLQGRELARRGWRVTVASTEEARGSVDRFPELRFLSLGQVEVAREDADRLLTRVTAEPDFMKGMMMIVSALGEAWTLMYDALVPALRANPPRLLVSDFATTAGMDAADATGIPLVVNNADLLPVLPAGLLPSAPGVPAILSGKSASEGSATAKWTYPLRRGLEIGGSSLVIGRRHNQMRAMRGLPPIGFHERLRDRLVLVNSAFGLEYPRPLPPLVRMVGPMLPEVETLPEEMDRWLASGPPVVLVSLGTVSAPSSELLGRIAEGLRSTEFRALWALRKDLHPLLPEVAATVRVEAWVPQLASILRHPNVRAFVSHCGTNSVQESLLNGTPVIGIPLFGVQGDMAIRLEDAGVGVHLAKHRFTPASLRDAILRVIKDDRFRENLPAIQSSMRLAGGISRAADLIEETANVGAGHYAEPQRWRVRHAAQRGT